MLECLQWFRTDKIFNVAPLMCLPCSCSQHPTCNKVHEEKVKASQAAGVLGEHVVRTQAAAAAAAAVSSSESGAKFNRLVPL